MLEKELETFREKREELLADQGRFVVIAGDKVLGIYAVYEDALKIGYEKCGTDPFLVKRIEQDESVHHFTRDVTLPCRT